MSSSVDRSRQTPLTCSECRDGLTAFVEAVLSNAVEPEGTPTLAHLHVCRPCARLYADLAHMLSAVDVERLEATVVEDLPVPADHAGLLNLWRVQLSLSNLAEDDHGAAAALSVLGMIHRCRGDLEEARAAHELVLQLEPHDWLSRLRSEIDLAWLAEAGHRLFDAVRHLAAGSMIAVSAGDRSWSHRLANLRRRVTAAATRTLLPPPLAIEAATAVGDTILVVNSGREVPVEFREPLMLDGEGYVSLAVSITRDHGLPDPIVLDLVFMPTGDVIWQGLIDTDARSQLEAYGGLAISAMLPSANAAAPHTDSRDQGGFPERWEIARRTCELRIWWSAATL
jgi:hypothetical protein